MGLPEGWAENYVKQAFYKWKPKEKLDTEVENVPVPIPIRYEEITSTEEELEVKEVNTKPSVQETDTKPVSSNQVFTHSESYNGSSFENYTWSQTIKDIDIILKVPEGTTSKNLKVAIDPKSLSVKLKADGSVLLEGELCHKCKHLDALWSLDGIKLEMHLDKTSEVWWDCLLTTEPRLDMSKIDCSRPFDELSEEAQSKIEELTWNQDRKRLGLPTTQEILMQETLKKAWSAEGSPFSGPFDPTAVQFQS